MFIVNGCRLSGVFVHLLLALVWAGLGSPPPATAQPVDSLTAHFIQVADSARHLIDTNHDREAFALLRIALQNPARLRSPLGSVHLYYQLGIGERKVSHLDEALVALRQANQLALQLHDTTQLCRVGYALSVVYADQGNMMVSIEQSHRILSYKPNPQITLTFFLLLAGLYGEMGNKSLSKTYSERYVDLARRSTVLFDRLGAECYQAQLLEEQGKYRQTIVCLRRALSLSGKIAGRNDNLPELFTNLARVYRKLRQWQPAMKALNEALYWEGRYHSLATKTVVYTEMASLLADQGKPQQAVRAGELAVTFARQSNRPSDLLHALNVFQQVLARNGQYRAAWSTANAVRQLADSLSNSAKTKTIAQVETRYKVAAKEIIILDLQKDKAIRALQATAHQRELATIRQQQVLLLGLVTGLTIFVGIISYLLTRTRRLQKKTEQQRQLLETQTDELQLVNANKDKLFSIVSHDLRAPFYNLQHLLQNFQQTPIQSATWPSLVAQLTERVDQLSRLINNLLYWSLAQQGQLRDRPEEVSIGAILTNCQTLLMETIHHKALQVELHGPEVYLWADDAQMRLIIRNLLDNAIKFSPVAGSITIHWTSEPTGVYLEAVNQIASATVTGAHLGLRIVAELLERQGGSITIDQSQVSRWRVRVHWPARRVVPSDNVVEMSAGF